MITCTFIFNTCTELNLVSRDNPFLVVSSELADQAPIAVFDVVGNRRHEVVVAVVVKIAREGVEGHGEAVWAVLEIAEALPGKASQVDVLAVTAKVKAVVDSPHTQTRVVDEADVAECGVDDDVVALRLERYQDVGNVVCGKTKQTR